MDNLRYLITAFLFLFVVHISAQENIIKFGFSDALLGNFNLSYEIPVSKQNSIQFKIGYWKPSASLFLNEKSVTPSGYELQKENGGINASAEYRFYMIQKEAPLGLYIAPYMRFINQSSVYTDNIDGDAFDVDTRINTFGMGVQIGYQLIIKEIITMDFYFFGAGLDHHNLQLKYVLQEPQTGFDYNSITDNVTAVFEDFNYLKKRLEHDVQPNHLISKLPFLFPGYRIGMSIGVAF